MIMEILSKVSLFISLLGILVIVWGVILILFRLIAYEFTRLKGDRFYQEREALRHQLGSYLFFGLEILIAADIINTITDPSITEIIILASIVVIRTVISYFLDLEMAGFGYNKNDTSK